MKNKKLTKISKIKKYKSTKPSEYRLPGQARRKQRPTYKSFRLYKHIKPKNFVKLPSSWKVLKESMTLLFKNKKTMLGFVAIFLILNIIFVKGFSSNLGLEDIKTTFNEAGVSVNNLFTSFVLFVSLITASNSSYSDAASVYQGILLIIGSLSSIWIIRKFSSKTNDQVSLKGSFYKSTQQLVPFLGTLLFIILELIPMLLGFALISFVTTENVGFGGGESFAIVLLGLTLSLLSIYLISGSIASIYIVTLPDAEPVKSIIASHKLLYLHRWSVLRKLVMLFIYIFIINVVIVVPLILLLPANFSFVAEYTLITFSIINLVLVHNFLYTMYKSLL